MSFTQQEKRARNWRGGTIVAAAGALGFLFIAAGVERSAFAAIDEAGLRLWRREEPEQLIGPAGVATWWRAITVLGDASTIIVTMVAAILLWLRAGARWAAVFAASTVAGGYLMSVGLKVFFGRERPEVVPALAEVGTSSFPSQHAMVTMLAFLTIALVEARRAKPNSRGWWIGLAVVLSGFVGTSRVVLGVHYPSDVVAGWLAGVAWVVGAWTIAEGAIARGTDERF